jgi:hypothetical protein
MNANKISNTDKGFMHTASIMLPCIIANSALCPPHPGQGIPVNNLKGQYSGIPM